MHISHFVFSCVPIPICFQDHFSVTERVIIDLSLFFELSYTNL